MSQPASLPMPVPSKRCGKCRKVKPLDDFYARSPEGGHRSACKTCFENQGGRRSRASLARLRAAVLGRYGNRCACCGTTDDLTIDHVGGGGQAHRIALFGRSDTGSAAFYRWLIAQGFPPGYQTLCRPCNASKFDGEACRLDHAAPPGWKRCTGPCGRTRPLADYHRAGDRGRDGRDSWCRDCRNAG